GGPRGDNLFKRVDLGYLVDMNVIRELEYDFVLRRTGGVEQRVDHRDRAAVVLDHVRHEQPFELDAAGRVELCHLSVGEHAGHGHHVDHATHHHLHAEGVCF